MEVAVGETSSRVLTEPKPIVTEVCKNKEVTILEEKLLETNKKLMPFLHLPIQSGSDKILKKMNRKHTRKKYIEIIEKLKKGRSDIALSSDFIVGFPGESDQDFYDTMDSIKEVEFSIAYSFIFYTGGRRVRNSRTSS